VTTATKNECGKMRTKETAYEVWQSPDGSWTWYVLKKYQSPAKEAANKYARWMCLVITPMTGPGGDMGDTYVTDVTSYARRIK
jgi:hypothetical protein